MQIFYRISDNSYRKSKLPGTNKKICLDNFLSIFQNPIIIADNCTSSLDFIKPSHIIHLGNAGSFKYALDLACQLDNNEVVYFVEDDYLHRDKSVQACLEGSELGEYFTLYDHPDKYVFGEESKIIRTSLSHWRFTNSTCMTFGSKVKYLKRDYDIWKKYLNGEHPNDHGIFTELNKKIALPIPGFAFHTDLMYFGQSGRLLIDDWAVKFALNQFDITGLESLLVGKTDWGKLMLLEAIKGI